MNNISRYITSRYLAYANATHIKQYPQLVGFAFDAITCSIHLDGRFEKDELRLLEESVFPKLESNTICLDIGANIGNHSLAFSPFFAYVIALEPHPVSFKLLQINAELVENVKAIHIGASDKTGSVKVAINKLNQGATSIGKTTTPNTAKLEFNVAPVDELDAINLGLPISFIKIDVEGHEPEALRGAERVIRANHPVVAIEVLPSDVANGTSEAMEILKSFGYNNFYNMQEKGWLGRLPRRPKKLIRLLLTLFTGTRPPKADVLVRVERLERRSYPMLICTNGLNLDS